MALPSLKSHPMLAVSLRSLWSHKLRMALTVVAVALGTAFIAGAFMFTAMMASTFSTLVSGQYAGVDVVVDAEDDPAALDGEARADIEADDEVAAATVLGSQPVVVGGPDGETLQTGGAQIAPWYGPGERVGTPETITAGAAPEGPDEYLLGEKAARGAGLEVGDEITIVDSQGPRDGTVSGLIVLGEEDDPANDQLAVRAEEGSYLERYHPGGALPRLSVDLHGDDPNAEAAARRLTDEHPGLEATPGKELAEEESQQLREDLNFINYFLVAFGGVGLLVGTFLIANTFAMTVSQRTREFALLRALGASRRQITGSVVGEAVVLGLVGSALGVGLGIGLVALIVAAMSALGVEGVGGGLGITATGLVVPVVVGVLVTVLSAWAPARRAGSVPPVAAMSASAAGARGSLKARTVAGAAVLAAGVAAAVVGVAWDSLETRDRAIVVGIGAVAVFVGVFLASPAASLPVVPRIGRVVGWPFGAMGRLAAENSRRTPTRTATTAFALTLGVALVSAIGMLGSSMKASVATILDEQIASDFMVGTLTPGITLPAEAGWRVAGAEGVASTMETAMAPVTVSGADLFGEGAQFGFSYVVDGDLTEAYPFDVVEAADGAGENPLDLRGERGVVAHEAVAERLGWEVGDELDVAPSLGGEGTSAPLLATYRADEIYEGFFVSPAAAGEAVDLVSTAQLMRVDVHAEPGFDHEALRANLEDAVEDLLVAQVLDADDLSAEVDALIDALLAILYALLSLAVVIAILGIVNTLTLNVLERRQEIGMMRAVGARRGQVALMVVLEAVQIAVFGAALGIAVGLGLGLAFLEVIRDTGLNTISVPIAAQFGILAASVAVGVAAAAWPARRAAAIPPLDAIADD